MTPAGSGGRRRHAVDSGRWSAPEVSDNVNTDQLDNLCLTHEEEADIVALIKTLTDVYVSLLTR